MAKIRTAKRKFGLLLCKKHMPDDVYKIIIQKQSEIKAESLKQFSMENTIYKLIRESV